MLVLNDPGKPKGKGKRIIYLFYKKIFSLEYLLNENLTVVDLNSEPELKEWLTLNY